MMEFRDEPPQKISRNRKSVTQRAVNELLENPGKWGKAFTIDTNMYPTAARNVADKARNKRTKAWQVPGEWEVEIYTVGKFAQVWIRYTPEGE